MDFSSSPLKYYQNRQSGRWLLLLTLAHYGRQWTKKVLRNTNYSSLELITRHWIPWKRITI